MASFQPQQDEGYSEDPLTMQLSGEGGRDIMKAGLPVWLSDMSIADRTRLAISIIHGLPTTSVSEVADAIRPRLFLDFFDRLPAEVCLKILGYLDPVSLIRTAQASRDWMSLALDWKLWEQLYYLEGWRIIPSELRQFEADLASKQLLQARARPSIDYGDEHTHKKRATPKLMSATSRLGDDSEMLDVESSPSPKQESIFGKRLQPTFTDIREKTEDSRAVNEHFTIAPRSTTLPGQILDNNFPTQYSQGLPKTSNHRDSVWSAKSSSGFDLSFLSSLMIQDRWEKANLHKLNWQYLYTQRRRLEQNWESEKFVNFQLPHPDHLEEAHRECIYTIQHSGKYLVSGSRDQTLRIWDLDTRRLVRNPLTGHTGSVLCLQFDADPDEDLIVSGSSDATVILWKFSTGERIQVLKKAHRESVLNVRFDHRILVTCSKDKTIKIFNRRPLHPGELGYPAPMRLDPVPTVLNNYGFNPSPFAGLPVKPPFSLIGCLDGHGAAVNAVQIYKNEIVSASGDRNVKIWDWPLQTCTRTLVGHQKGIACVQYDGRRIVSGSSDNEVKVFDKQTGLEVASLRGHNSLVRTVQAGFGDLPYSAEEDQADARHVDYEYFKAVDAGAVPREIARGRPRNAGSRRPEDIMAYGATLPPGGGGGRYGRIVSGSYDETIIIWRRDKEGVWKAQHTLRQEDAALTAAKSGRERRAPLQDNLDAPAAGTQAYYHHVINLAVPQGPNALRNAIAAHPHLIQYPHLQIAIAAEPVQLVRNQMRTIVAQALARQQILLAQQLLAAGQPGPAAQAISSVPALQSQNSGTNIPSLQSQLTAASVAVNQMTGASQGLSQGSNATSQTAQPGPAQQTATAPVHPHLVPASMARVFKLQFDARRIICCSQTPIIVGWDFANGDEKIIEASRFFAPVE